MNTAEYVDSLINTQKAEGRSGQEIAWNAALACVGWPYVFGARGEYCTVANRKKYYRDAHPTIKTACKAYDGGSCSGCKWYPNGKKVRCFDCRGFTYWVLLQVFGWKLMGTGATAQWKDANNWKANGAISDGIPADTLVCLFVQKGTTMEHTGFGFNNETVECSAGVQHFTTRKAKWTHWGVPACLEGDVPVPTPTPAPSGHKTLRRGDKGPAVVELQTDLTRLGYGLGPCGIDGDYGKATKSAVEQLQLKHGLVVDGICGPKTWVAIDQDLAALDQPAPIVTYTVNIPGLSLEEARKLCEQYPKAVISEGSVAG